MTQHIYHDADKKNKTKNRINDKNMVKKIIYTKIKRKVSLKPISKSVKNIFNLVKKFF